MTTQRKLTTILSADVEGYSRLMGADEEGTFSALKASRDVIACHIAGYDGRVVNTWGDALIAEFASVVSAVRAAIDIQGELAERNAGKPPDMRMLYRIGINLGDVIVDGDDIYGDGVNIAARLQSEAQPGGVLISNSVYDQVRNKLTVAFEFLGELDVKNIEEAVPAFAIRIGAAPEPQTPASPPAKPRPAPVADPRWGRDGTPSPSPRNAPEPVDAQEKRRRIFLVGVPALLVGINLLTWGGTFWAKWPLLAFAILGALHWARRRGVDQPLAFLGVVAATVLLVNLFTWEGRFWAIWPLLAMAVLAAARWYLRPDESRE